MFLTRRKSTIMDRGVDGAAGKKQSVDGVKHENADHSTSGVERAGGVMGEKRGVGVIGEKRGDGGDR